MRARRLAALPVVRGEELLGVLTEEDLLDFLAEAVDGSRKQPHITSERLQGRLAMNPSEAAGPWTRQGRPG
jgi:hypothetical protein